MGSNRLLQLENGKGLAKVVVCSGLTAPVVIHPMVHGEPALTAQAFYYLDQLESVAKLRFETAAEELPDDKIELLMDNYLFEYSKIHPESRMSFKVLEGNLWQQDGSDNYLLADGGLTRILAVDCANDPTVLSLQAIDPEDRVDLQDWDIGRNYIEDCLDSYIISLTKVLDKKVHARILPGYRGDGYFGNMRVVEPDRSLLDYRSAMALSDISFYNVFKREDSDYLKTSHDHFLPVERVTATRFHNPVMLSHYFSGMHELNSLKSYVGFYNVLEYYFEEAPRILKKNARTEKHQLECVVELLVTDKEVCEFLQGMDAESLKLIKSDLRTSSGMSINKYDSKNGPNKDLARWLYEIRCAIVHSKKTHKGKLAPAFEPYTAESQALRKVSLVIRWLAVRCIERDSLLNVYSI